MNTLDIIDNFSYLTEWEDKYAYLIELGDALPPFPETDKTDNNLVRGCQSQVWMTHTKQGDQHHFSVTSDAHIVRGLAAILMALVNDKTADEIRAVDIDALFQQMGLADHLSPTRRNGFFSMIERIRNEIDRS